MQDLFCSQSLSPIPLLQTNPFCRSRQSRNDNFIAIIETLANEHVLSVTEIDLNFTDLKLTVLSNPNRILVTNVIAIQSHHIFKWLALDLGIQKRIQN